MTKERTEIDTKVRGRLIYKRYCVWVGVWKLSCKWWRSIDSIHNNISIYPHFLSPINKSKSRWQPLYSSICMYIMSMWVCCWNWKIRSEDTNREERMERKREVLRINSLWILYTLECPFLCGKLCFWNINHRSCNLCCCLWRIGREQWEMCNFGGVILGWIKNIIWT